MCDRISDHRKGDPRICHRTLIGVNTDFTELKFHNISGKGSYEDERRTCYIIHDVV